MSNTQYSSFFAQPYDQSATGFYFSCMESYTKQVEVAVNVDGQPVEEFEIQPNYDVSSELFKACGINQSNLEQWFDEIDLLNDGQKVALFYLMDNNVCKDLDDAISQLDDVSISECNIEEAATQLFDDCYLSEVPKAVHIYIDYEAFARDCQMGGDIVEFKFDGVTYTCTNASSL